MKRRIPELMIFAAVLTADALARTFTFLQMENLGLFLTTPDYFRDTFALPLPLSHLTAGFIIQFFNMKYIGALFDALLVTATFTATGGALRRTGMPFASIFSALICGAIWTASALTGDLTPVTAALLAALALRLASSVFLKQNGSGDESIWQTIVCCIIFAASAVLVTASPKVRKTELWSKVEYSALRHDWPAVLQTATVEQCSADAGLLPYALLALTYTDRLPAEMFRYPIQGPESLDTEGWESQEGYFFGYLLYDCYGCTNEAVHQLFQSSTYLPHGTSFCTLRQLSRLTFAAGDLALARKYATILSHSTLHGRWARKFLNQVELSEATGTSRTRSTPSQSAAAALVSHDATFNTAALISDGLYSKPMADRVLCSLLARRDLQTFKKVLDTQRPIYGEDLPTSFRQALDLIDNPMGGSKAGVNYINYYFAGTGQTTGTIRN